MERPYISADLCCSIPNSDDFDVSCHQQLALTLLPVQDQPGILVARKEVCECTESRHQFNVLSFVVSEDFDDTV